MHERRKRGAKDRASWIFMHNTGKVEGGLMVLFSSLVLSVAPSPLEIFLPTPFDALAPMPASLWQLRKFTLYN